VLVCHGHSFPAIPLSRGIAVLVTRWPVGAGTAMILFNDPATERGTEEQKEQMKTVTIHLRGVESADSYTAVSAKSLSINEAGHVTFTDGDGNLWQTELSEVCTISIKEEADYAADLLGRVLETGLELLALYIRVGNTDAANKQAASLAPFVERAKQMMQNQKA
jgi:hypothetical protein